MKSPRTWVALFGRSDSSTTGAVSFANPSARVGEGGSGAGFLGGRTASLKLAALAVIAAAALMALGVGSAIAATVNNPIGEITGPAPGIPFSSELKSESVAVNDKNGHIYVADSGTHRVYDFASATDTAPTVWDGSATPAGEWTGVVAVAVDNSSGDIYVSDSAHAVIDKFDQNGSLIETFGDTEPTANGQLAGLKTPAASFLPTNNGSFGIVVDQASGDLYAIDAGHEVIDVFDSAGAYLEQFTEKPGGLYSGEGAVTDGIAVNGKSGELLVSDSLDLRTYRFDLATGAFIAVIDGSETPAGSFGNLYTSVAADESTGDIYINDNEHEVVDRYESDATYSGSQIKGVPTGSYGALAVDQETGNLYVSTNTATPSVKIFGPPVVIPDATTKPAAPVTTTTATLNGEVNPLEIEVEECFFEYGETTAYGETSECDPNPAAIGEGNAPVAVHADLTALKPGSTYHYRLVAANENGANHESGDQQFFTGASIDFTSVSQVSATSATLETEINPHGVATTFHFEYDTVPYAEGEAPHGTSTPTGTAGSGTADVTRSASIQGLQSGTIYHFRVVATNSLGTVQGPDRSFTTQGATASLLPDSRAWELVSPPDKHGAPLEAISGEGADIQAAADGSALAYAANGPIDAEPAGTRARTQLLATRSGTGAWSTEDLATPHQAPVGVTPGAPSEYKLFSSDLSHAAVEPAGATPLSPQTTEFTPYLRQPTGEYMPLVTAANVPPDVHFGGTEAEPEVFTGGPEFRVGTPDLAHLLLTSPQPLTEDFIPGFESAGNNVFEWSDGALHLVSTIPPGAATVCGGAAPACLPASEAGQSSEAGFQDFQVRNAISNDGSRVVFATVHGKTGLYLRDLIRGETVQLDASQGGSGKSGGGSFQLASTDGSRVFFTDGGALTEDATVANGKPDLYMCEIEVDAEGHLACALSDLTANSVDPGEPASVLGNVLGSSDDGSSVYFVTQGALTEDAVHGNCSTVQNEKTKEEEGIGACNLYRYDLAGETIHLVAVLSGRDRNSWNGRGGSGRDLGSLTARVSSNGRYLAFMSERPITGYDNRDAKSDVRDEEVFIYDSQRQPGAQLVCASCNPTGARPRGVEGIDFPGLLVDGPLLWKQQWLAASIPGWTRIDGVHAIYQSRYLSNSGRLFFPSMLWCRGTPTASRMSTSSSFPRAPASR